MVKFVDELPPRNTHLLRGRAPDPERIAIAETLRLQPGTWGIVAEGDTKKVSGLASSLKNGNGAFKPKDHYESTTRTEAGHTVVYARYVGPVDEVVSDPETADAIAAFLGDTEEPSEAVEADNPPHTHMGYPTAI